MESFEAKSFGVSLKTHPNDIDDWLAGDMKSFGVSLKSQPPWQHDQPQHRKQPWQTTEGKELTP